VTGSATRLASCATGAEFYVALKFGRDVQRQFAIRVRHQGFGVTTPLSDRAADRLALFRLTPVFQMIAVAERRSNPWVPDILRPQYLDR